MYLNFFFSVTRFLNAASLAFNPLDKSKTVTNSRRQFKIFYFFSQKIGFTMNANCLLMDKSHKMSNSLKLKQTENTIINLSSADFA